MNIPRLPTHWKSPLPRLEVLFSGFLHERGWFLSRAKGLAVDRHGAPLAWFTYAALEFLGDRIDPGWTVFEYGAGNGTLWWAARVRAVHAVEHDPGWHAALRPRLPPNARVERVSDAAVDYAASVRKPGLAFDVVVVDGIHRNECAAAAVGALSARGVLVWDDAQRAEYAPGMTALAAAGFRRLDFGGPAPVSKHASRTAVFYRPDNVLGL